jgi:hypothetical protein
MSVVPAKFPERITFYENHLEPFATNAVAIGITAAEASDLEVKTTAAREALTNRDLAQQAAESATLAMRDAIDAMSGAGAALIKKIRAKAEQTGGYSVYSLAEIPAPALPSPVGPPGAVTELTTTLNVNGTLNMKWKCTNPAGAKGTVYQVWRQIAGGGFTYLGGSGGKEFTDDTIPAGTSSLTYQIQAVRSTAVGPWAQFNVNFGAPNGMVVTQTTPAKLAA